MNTYTESSLVHTINKGLVKTVIECGGADGCDTSGIQQHYNADVYVFECDPTLLPTLQNKATQRIHVIPIGLWGEECEREFLYVDRKHSTNKTVGISSMFPWADLGNHRRNNPSYLIQIPTKVICTTIDKFCERNSIKPDLLCLDTQGSELEILRGATATLKNIHYIVTEVNYKPQYRGSCDFEQLKEFLSQNNFKLIKDIHCSPQFGNALFTRI